MRRVRPTSDYMDMIQANLDLVDAVLEFITTVMR